MNSSTKSWGNTISKEGEVSRVWAGNLDKNTECADLGMFIHYLSILND